MKKLLYVLLLFSFINGICAQNPTVIDRTDHDNDGIYDNIDIDDDNDGIPDLIECNGIDPLTDNDGDGVPVYLDDDDNNNYLGDFNNQVESAFDLDGDGIPNHFDLDSDGDGLFDTAESGRLNVPVGSDVNFDGILEGNVGNNGLVDDVESSPDSGSVAYTYLDWDNDGTNDFLDTDDDGDGILTINEHADDNGNSYPDDGIDTDSDGNPNYHDIDDDGDGINTFFEDIELPHNYPQDGNPLNDDTDNDGIPNYLDVDDDNDGILTIEEHPDDNNNHEPDDALDSNSDGIPDYLDFFNTITPISITINNNTNPNLSQGDLVTYEITVENTGNINLQNVEIYCDNAQVQADNIINLLPGQSQILTALHQVTTADIVCGQINCKAYGRFVINAQMLVYRADANPENTIPNEPAVTSLDNNLNFTDYWKNYTAYDYINDIAHTPEANWLATDVGLVKFEKNTQQFFYFNKSNLNLWANQIYAVAYEESTELLWIGTDNGLFKYDGNTFINYQPENSIFPRNVFDIFIDNNGTKWIGTDSGLIKWPISDNIEIFNPSNSNIPFDYVKSITQTEDGKLWLASMENLANFNGNTWEFIDGQANFDYNKIKYIIPYHNDILIQTEWTSFLYWTQYYYFEDLNPIPTCGNEPAAIAVAVDEDNNIWLGRSRGINILNFTSYPPDLNNFPMIEEPVYFVSIDDNNDKWLNTPAKLNKYDDANYNSYPMQSNGLISNTINTLCVDNTGKTWTTTGRKLLDLENEEWQVHYQSLNPDYENYTFHSITADANNTIWATAWGTYGLIYYQNEHFHLNLDSYVNNPQAISFDSNQNLWIGDADGLNFYDGNLWTFYTPDNTNIPDSMVKLIEIDSNDEIWYINNNNQVVHFVNENAVIYDYTNSILPDDFLTSLTIDTNNQVWIGSRNHGFFKFDGTNWSVYNTSNSDLPDDKILSIKAFNNDIWIGTYDSGLVKFSGNGFYVYNTDNSMLLRNRINQIAIDNQYNIWIATQGGGISKFNEIGLGIYQNMLENNPDLILYPNPTQNFIYLSCKEEIYVQEISIYTLSGQLITEKHPKNQKDYLINIHKINKGIYLAIIKTDTGIYQRKFIKK